MRTFSRTRGRFWFAVPPLRLAAAGGGLVVGGIGCLAAAWVLQMVALRLGMQLPAALVWGGAAVSIWGVLLLAAAIVWRMRMKPETIIRVRVFEALASHAYGNPLALAEGQLLPRVRCSSSSMGYRVRVEGAAATVEKVEATRSAVSSALRGRFRSWAVVAVDVGVSNDYVDFLLENVQVDHTISVASLADLRPRSVTQLNVQHGLAIDLTSSGSILVAGKTRSGKTTGVIALLLQVLSLGQDAHGSRVAIVDPKQAELSRLPGVVSLDPNGEAREILDFVRGFEETIQARQRHLNDLSAVHGDVVKWWDAGMHPSFLFFDEFVALRSLYPSSAAKDHAGYTVKDFDAALRRIVTMGASAGCFVILSIAQASAEQIPTMLRDAFSTRILFRPTPDEGRLMWESSQVTGMPSRLYGPGEAWFTSSDGEHDAIHVVKFPKWAEGFKAYAELGRLLQSYGAEKPSGSTPPSC